MEKTNKVFAVVIEVWDRKIHARSKEGRNKTKDKKNEGREREKAERKIGNQLSGCYNQLAHPLLPV